ncbi:50S ribosomal protein L32 [candidate division WOR-3 bacterium]|nr:50S ribosomal protein L32 [candidate division WOR-3 bacterium]MCK4583980.1 50S ribosomal protein L32 [candidate division WOR-3 bacterium]TET77588.1 MAG: 50S ribosomal protein L32 [Candidatus Cloacimonadota bacterium]
MALPKQKQSKTRGKKRRTHWKLSFPGLIMCPHCHSLKLPHRVCRNCGYYKGKEIIKIKEK